MVPRLTYNALISVDLETRRRDSREPTQFWALSSIHHPSSIILRIPSGYEIRCTVKHS